MYVSLIFLIHFKANIFKLIEFLSIFSIFLFFSALNEGLNFEKIILPRRNLRSTAELPPVVSCMSYLLLFSTNIEF